MNNAERAADLFTSGLTCSQAILTVFGDSYGLDTEMGQKLARPFGGGMGRLGRTCGAVTGAVLVLGLAQDHQEESVARPHAYSQVQEFFRRFAALHGTTECKALLGADISTEEGFKKAKEGQLIAKLCPGFVRDAAIVLEEVLED